MMFVESGTFFLGQEGRIRNIIRDNVYLSQFVILAREGCDTSNCMYFGRQIQWYIQNSMHARRLEHIKGLNSTNPTCPLYNHQLQHHGDDIPEFMMTKVKKIRSNKERLVYESEIIAEDQDKKWEIWRQQV